MGFKKLRTGVPQNSLRDAKWPELFFFQVIKIRLFWKFLRKFCIFNCARRHLCK